MQGGAINFDIFRSLAARPAAGQKIGSLPVSFPGLPVTTISYSLQCFDYGAEGMIDFKVINQ